MRNPLSQAEIDALMQSLLPAGGEDTLFQQKGNVTKPYDFRRPGKFNKDSIHTLVVIHDTFARLLQGQLSAALRTRVQASVRSTNQYTYGEFTQLLPNPTVVAQFEMTPLPGSCLVELSHNIAYAIIERVFGGQGSDSQPQRALSEIEAGVIQRMVQDMFGPLQESWRNVAEVKPAMGSLETNPLFLQAAAPSEAVVAITLSVDIGEHKGHMALVFPFTTVEPVLARLSTHRWLESVRPANEDERRTIRRSVESTMVKVHAELGRTRVRVQEFVDLKVGDLIMLETKTSDPVPVYVGDRLVFYGRPGIIGRQMSVQVTCTVANVRSGGDPVAQ